MGYKSTFKGYLSPFLKLTAYMIELMIRIENIGRMYTGHRLFEIGKKTTDLLKTNNMAIHT